MQQLLAAAAVVVLSSLHSTLASEAGEAYGKLLTDNKASAIVADELTGKVTPLFTGYAAINEDVPVGILVSCHYGPKPFPSGPGSQSASAKKYFNDIAYIVGDGYQPATNIQPKGAYNQSWALGLVWTGWCQFDALHRPACNFTLDKFSRASGLTQIMRMPDANIKFVSCGIYMDNTLVNSTTCFQDDSTTVVPVTGAYPENSVSRIQFFSTYQDTSPDGPPGEYTLQYSCQYAWNSPIIFNPPGNFGGLDPRITGVLPNFQNGLFGPPGNGGNLGRRLLRGWHF